MRSGSSINSITCPSPDIAAYIDGELTPVDELELELHMAGCDTCSIELNSQKEFLLCLDAGLKEDRKLELPADFAREITANAEASVAGLRRPSELYHFVFICTAVILFAMFAAGPRTADALDVVYGGGEKALIVAGFFSRLILDLFLGIAVVLRSFAAQFRSDVIAAVVLSMMLAVPVLVLSRKMLRVGRA
jgi:hypothetical protein